uniref:Uncharacterized protein n=1 Tax=Zea mays TaxID=4577 RepID=B6U5T9_MAIZE|nr:hypothetical protein [Zea mays]
MPGEKLRSTCVDLPQARDVGMDGLGHGVPLPVRVSPRCRNPDVDRSRLNLVADEQATEDSEVQLVETRSVHVGFGGFYPGPTVNWVFPGPNGVTPQVGFGGMPGSSAFPGGGGVVDIHGGAGAGAGAGAVAKKP